MIMTAPRPRTTRPPDPNQVLRISEAARETGYSPRHLRTLCAAGVIRSTQLRGGTGYRIRRAWLMAAFPSLYDQP